MTCIILNNNTYLLIIILSTLLISCEKEKLPINKSIGMEGTYVFKKVIFSIADNSSKSESNYYQKGDTFLNLDIIDGIDTIITDFSLMRINNSNIYFDAKIYNKDTIWKNQYFSIVENPTTYGLGVIDFYVIGTRRRWNVETLNGKEISIITPLIWPYGSNGPAYSTVFLLNKIDQ
jgi:hypothetical protein